MKLLFDVTRRRLGGDQYVGAPGRDNEGMEAADGGEEAVLDHIVGVEEMGLDLLDDPR